MQWWLDNSIPLIFGVTMSLLAVSETRMLMKRRNWTFRQLVDFLRNGVSKLADGLVWKLCSCVLVTVAVSVVSFREVWLTDVFHVIVMASLTLAWVESKLKDLFQ